MELESTQKGQTVEANSTLGNHSVKSGFQGLKPFLWCGSSIISLAIVFSGSPIYAKEAEQLPAPRTSPNPILELKTALHSDASSKNDSVANFTTKANEDALSAAPGKEPQSAPAQGLAAASEEPDDSSQTLKQTTSSSTESSIESTKPAFPSDRTAQTDPSIPPDDSIPESSEPSSEPESGDASEEPLREQWRFSVEPYFFVPLSVQADVTVAGRSASLDLGVDDILNLDRAFDAGLRLEAQHNRLGFILDAFYVSAAQSGTVGLTFPAESLQRFGINTAARVEGDASIAVDQLTIDAAVSYRVVDTVLGNSTASSPAYPRLVVAPILGLRTRFLWQELEVDNVRLGEFSLPIDREYSASSTTIEPLLGAQIGLDLSERWAMNMRGDVSGFNINADQDFTWNLLIGTQYHFSPNLSLQLAYRFNGFDFEDGDGLRRTRLNLYQNGLWLSGIFRF